MPSTQTPRLILAFVFLAFSSLACSAVERLSAEPPTPTMPPTPLPSSTPAPSPSPGDDGTPTPAGLSPEVEASMDEIEDQIVELRGLLPSAPVDRALLTPDELRQHVLDDFLDDYSQEDAADDVRVYALLGLLEPDFDLWNLFLELYSEQIAGFYDDEVQKMYVVQGEGFGGLERLTYAHEYVHALQDQTYDLEDGIGYSDETCDANGDLCTALASLIEGDASLAEEKWLENFATKEDLDQILAFYDTYTSPVFDAAPRFIQEDFYFPYEQGIEFVRMLYLDGGWRAVDKAYADLPGSSEQILHLDLYGKDGPVRLEIPDLANTLGSEWREVERNILGEFYTRLMLEEQLEEERASRAAQGWAGDYLLVFAKESQDVLVLVTAWDSIGDAQDFATAFRDYGGQRFGTKDSAMDSGFTWSLDGLNVLFERRSDQSLLILGPDAAILDTVRQAVPFPAPQVKDGD